LRIHEKTAQIELLESALYGGVEMCGSVTVRIIYNIDDKEVTNYFNGS
jgi:hypothetical protein